MQSPVPPVVVSSSEWQTSGWRFAHPGLPLPQYPVAVPIPLNTTVRRFPPLQKYVHEDVDVHELTGASGSADAVTPASPMLRIAIETRMCHIGTR